MIAIDRARRAIVIALDDIHELFVAPVQDPLSHRFQNASGIDQIINKASPRQVASADTIDIHLPPGAGIAGERLQVKKRCRDTAISAPMT